MLGCFSMWFRSRLPAVWGVDGSYSEDLAVGSFVTMSPRAKMHAVLTQSNTVIIFYSCENITFYPLHCN
jgi:hypothetical protein